MAKLHAGSCFSKACDGGSLMSSFRIVFQVEGFHANPWAPFRYSKGAGEREDLSCLFDEPVAGGWVFYRHDAPWSSNRGRPLEREELDKFRKRVRWMRREPDWSLGAQRRGSFTDALSAGGIHSAAAYLKAMGG